MSASKSTAGRLLRLKDRSGCRCCKVDFLKDEVRFGMVEKRGETSDGARRYQSLSSWDELCWSWRESESNMLKSIGPLGACILRRFAEGLPKLISSRLLTASGRFLGLDGGSIACVALNRFSNFVIGGFRSCSASTFSLSLHSKAFTAMLISSRSASVELRLRSGRGDALPEELDSQSILFVGLLGDVFILEDSWVLEVPLRMDRR